MPLLDAGTGGATGGAGAIVIDTDENASAIVDVTNYSTGASSADGVYVTTGEEAKGSWVTATTLTEDISEFIVVYHHPSGNNVRLDVGVGAAASELVLVPDITYSGREGGVRAQARIPIPLLSGTRIAVRARSNVEITIVVSIIPIVGSEARGFDGVDVMGDVTNNLGTQITLPGSIGTKGSWIEFAASTAREYAAMTVMLSNNGDFVHGESDRYRVDVGVGAAASEVVLFGDLPFASDAQHDMIHPNNYGPLPCRVPAGSRLAMRGWSNQTGQQLSGVLLGFWRTEDQ